MTAPLPPAPSGFPSCPGRRDSAMRSAVGPGLEQCRFALGVQCWNLSTAVPARPCLALASGLLLCKAASLGTCHALHCRHCPACLSCPACMAWPACLSCLSCLSCPACPACPAVRVPSRHQTSAVGVIHVPPSKRLAATAPPSEDGVSLTFPAGARQPRNGQPFRPGWPRRGSCQTRESQAAAFPHPSAAPSGSWRNRSIASSYAVCPLSVGRRAFWAPARREWTWHSRRCSPRGTSSAAASCGRTYSIPRSGTWLLALAPRPFFFFSGFVFDPWVEARVDGGEIQ